MNKLLFLISFVILTSLFWASCKKKTTTVPNEEEVITTLRYTLTPNGGGSTVVLSFKDLDGDGGNAPVITGDTLMAGKTYTGTLELLNETVTPADTITQEIKDEDEEHQFFFKSTVSNLTVAYSDSDSNGKPVGLSSTLTTGSASTGNLTITLRHEPNKSAIGVSGGDITNAGGETDIEITFPVIVQ